MCEEPYKSEIVEVIDDLIELVKKQKKRMDDIESIIDNLANACNKVQFNYDNIMDVVLVHLGNIRDNIVVGD